MDRAELGRRGETAAANFLRDKGYAILECNYRSRFGEIDIIAANHDTIVFTEVKTRRSIAFGYPAEAVTYQKQQKIIKMALFYLAQHPNRRSIRFDVIEIMLPPQGAMAINHIVNAFSA